MNNKRTFECPFDIYAPRKNKQDKDSMLLKNTMIYRHYANVELQMLASMFYYEGLPDSVDTNYLELCLIRYGVCAIVKVSNDEYYVGVPALLPPLDNYGFGTVVEMTTRNGKALGQHTVGVDCALIWNNNTRQPDFDLYRFAESLTDTDISLSSIVRNSRKSPIPVAKDSRLKTAIDESLNNAQNGVSEYTVVNDVSLVQEVNGAKPDIPVLNLTDPAVSDKIQYLSKYHDDLIRRLATLYGHDMQTTGKMAQQSVEEIQGFDSYSMIIPEVRLTERRKGIKMFNKVFGTNATVDYSLPWRYNIYKQDEQDDGVDIDNIENEAEV